LTDSNPKFVQGALSLLITLVEVMGEELAPHVAGVWTPLVERLGDAKLANRERAVDLAVALSTLVVPASAAVERVRPAWEHKNWRVRESTLLWFGRLLAQHDSPSSLGFSLKSILPLITKLLEDREPPVREAGIIAVEQMHRHIGDVLINELQRHNLRPSTLKPLLQRLGPETGDGSSQPSSPSGHDAQPQPSERASTANASSRRPASPGAGSRRGPPSARGGGGGWGSEQGGGGHSAGAHGGGDEESVAPISVYSEKELASEFDRVGEQLRHEVR